MSGVTKIEWADKVWNPVTGCTKVSEGCRHCYAETMAKRFWGDRKFTDVECHRERLGIPFKWKKPSKIFVNSMSDLFHPDVPFEFIDLVFMVMSRAHRHKFLILTKRPERMRDYIKGIEFELMQSQTYTNYRWEGTNLYNLGNILYNVWFGVSVEDQRTADERIPILLDIDCALRFVSIEPMLEKIDLRSFTTPAKCKRHNDHAPVYERNGAGFWHCPECRADWEHHRPLDWVICGGESGTGARPMHPDWVRSLQQQCHQSGTPFFFKQWGAWHPAKYPWLVNEGEKETVSGGYTFEDGTQMVRGGKGESLLDGHEWKQFPEVK